MEQKNKNVMIVSIVALALVLIGVTYAYFSARITGLESASTISLTAGRMGILYSEGDESVIVSNIYPRSEEWVTKTITLTGYNTTDQEMNYELGINIITNTFLYGELSYSLTGVGSNGTRITDVSNRRITKSTGFLKFGTGVFLQSNGDTHVYTLKIYFKDTGEDQNYNQEAVFNGKIGIREYSELGDNPCYTAGYQPGDTLTEGDTYISSQYTYKYMQHQLSPTWTTIPSGDGWGVILTNSSNITVIEELCTTINGKPIISMAGMFANSSIREVDVSSYDTSHVINMVGMFLGTTRLNRIYLSNFDTSNVTIMNSMFSNSAVSDVDITSFDTSNVTSFNYMFSGASNLTKLDLSSFDTSSATSMDNMFNGNVNLTTIYAANSFNTSLVPTTNIIFNNCPLLVGGAGTTFDSNYRTKTRAQIDGGTSNPGYFTAR